jgi:hypothetical protein
MRRGGLLALNLPAHGRIRLVDGTWITTLRPPGEVHLRIRSSGHLDRPGQATYGWTLLAAGYRPAPGSPEHRLADLCHLVAEHARPAGHRRH